MHGQLQKPAREDCCQLLPVVRSILQLHGANFKVTTALRLATASTMLPATMPDGSACLLVPLNCNAASAVNMSLHRACFLQSTLPM